MTNILLVVSLFLMSFISDFSSNNPFDQAVVLQNDEEAYRINKKSFVFHTRDTLSAYDAYSFLKGGLLDSSSYSENPGMNLADRAFWVLFDVRNEISDQSTFMIELDNPQLDRLGLYEIVDDSVNVLYETGDIYPFAHRPIAFRTFVLPVQVDHLHTKTFLLSADKRKSVNRFPLTIYTHKYFLESRVSNNLFKGIFFGLLSLLVVFSLIIYWNFRHRVFLFFSFYLVIFGFWLFTYLGFTYQFLTSNHPGFNLHVLPFTTMLWLLSFTWYAQSYFESKRYSPKTNLITNIALAVNYVFIPVWIIWPDFIIENGSALLLVRYTVTMIVVVAFVIFGVNYWRVSRVLTLQFLAAYFIFLFAGVFLMTSQFGLISVPKWLGNPVFIGSTIEIIVLSFGMVNQFNQKIDEEKSQVREKSELLMRELHHRVKNNLQFVSSMLGLQSLETSDEEVKKIMDESKKRIQTMTLIHQSLYLKDDINSFNANSYLNKIIEAVMSSYGLESDTHVNSRIDSIVLSSDIVLPLGLILNEMISNSVKHVYEEKKIFSINITLKMSSDEVYTFRYSDSGSNHAVNKKNGQKTSFGMRLITILSKQINGELRLDDKEGFNYRLKFRNQTSNVLKRA